ncbi:hypothetical protein D3C75_1184020 [compost metagenome]
MSQLTIQHDGYNLHITVWMCPKAATWCDDIIIGYPHRSKSRVIRVLILPKGKAVTAAQPASIKAGSCFGWNDLNHIA